MYIPDNSNAVLTLITETIVNWSDKIHRYNTRHATQGNYCQKAKLEIFKRSFSIPGAKVWNLIPSTWRNTFKFIFKRKIRAFLFDTLLDRDDEVDTLVQI